MSDKSEAVYIEVDGDVIWDSAKKSDANNKLKAIKMNSAERKKWKSTTEPYRMNASEIHNEVMQALCKFTFENNAAPKLITIDREVGLALEHEAKMYRFTSPLDTDRQTIMGVELSFVPNPDYDYIVE